MVGVEATTAGDVVIGVRYQCYRYRLDSVPCLSGDSLQSVGYPGRAGACTLQSHLRVGVASRYNAYYAVEDYVLL